MFVLNSDVFQNSFGVMEKRTVNSMKMKKPVVSPWDINSKY